MTAAVVRRPVPSPAGLSRSARMTVAKLRELVKNLSWTLCFGLRHKLPIFGWRRKDSGGWCGTDDAMKATQADLARREGDPHIAFLKKGKSFSFDAWIVQLMLADPDLEKMRYEGACWVHVILFVEWINSPDGIEACMATPGFEPESEVNEDTHRLGTSDPCPGFRPMSSFGDWLVWRQDQIPTSKYH